jgi:glycosyltransferase involved in cell wall biosynthesis
MHAVTTPGSPPALLACSSLVFYEPYWEVLRHLATTHRLSVLALGPERVGVPTVYAPTGWIAARPAADGIQTIALPLRDPSTPWLGFEPRALGQALRRLSPTAIWVHDEPTSGVAQQLLSRFWWRRRRTRIGVAIVENIWRAPRRLAGLRQRLLVRRIDHFLGGSTEAVRSFRAAFKADSASHEVAFLPTCDHRSESRRSGPGFVLGFAGRICAEKGWRVLIEALRGLPPDVTLRMAGTGPEDAELRAALQSAGLAGRATLLGVVSRRDLSSFYRGIDTLVVPSLTTPVWKEQLGAVLPEAMSAEVPVIGSDSGAIPEVIGAAGIVVPEGDPARLRDAIARLRSDPEERRRLAREGRRRYEREFSIEAFARRVAAFCSSALR